MEYINEEEMTNFTIVTIWTNSLIFMKWIMVDNDELIVMFVVCKRDIFIARGLI